MYGYYKFHTFIQGDWESEQELQAIRSRKEKRKIGERELQLWCSEIL